MELIELYVDITIATIATALTTIFGDWDKALSILVIIISIDYITGILRAIHNKKLNAKIGANGIIKKIMLLAVIALAAQMDRLLETEAELVRTAAIYFYIANDGISILENLTAIGIPFPKQITNRLLQLKGDDDK